MNKHLLLRKHNIFIILLESCNKEKMTEEKKEEEEREFRKNFQNIIALRNHDKI